VLLLLLPLPLLLLLLLLLLLAARCCVVRLMVFDTSNLPCSWRRLLLPRPAPLPVVCRCTSTSHTWRETRGQCYRCPASMSSTAACMLATP
jgi:hypothetical protein